MRQIIFTQELRAGVRATADLPVVIRHDGGFAERRAVIGRDGQCHVAHVAGVHAAPRDEDLASRAERDSRPATGTDVVGDCDVIAPGRAFVSGLRQVYV